MTQTNVLTSDYAAAKRRYDALSVETRRQLVRMLIPQLKVRFDAASVLQYGVSVFFDRQGGEIIKSGLCADDIAYIRLLGEFVRAAVHERPQLSLHDMIYTLNRAMRGDRGQRAVALHFGVAFVIAHVAHDVLSALPNTDTERLSQQMVHLLGLIRFDGNDIRQRAEIYGLLVPPEQPA
jgi:hypothetical protein